MKCISESKPNAIMGRVSVKWIISAVPIKPHPFILLLLSFLSVVGFGQSVNQLCADDKGTNLIAIDGSS